MLNTGFFKYIFKFLQGGCHSDYFYPPIERFGGYSDEPGVLRRPSVRKDFSCPLNNLNTVWNIMMIFHSYVEEVMTM